jgi:hypothetical protein
LRLVRCASGHLCSTTLKHEPGQPARTAESEVVSRRRATSHSSHATALITVSEPETCRASALRSHIYPFCNVLRVSAPPGTAVVDRRGVCCYVQYGNQPCPGPGPARRRQRCRGVQQRLGAAEAAVPGLGGMAHLLPGISHSSLPAWLRLPVRPWRPAGRADGGGAADGSHSWLL